MTQANPFGSKKPEVDEFEIMRQRLKQRGAARGDQAQRQVSRQSASLGNLPSGSALKLQQQAARQTEQQTGQEIQDVNVLQAQTQRAERESAAQRGLQRFGITTQAGTAIDTANIGSRTQLGSARIGAEAGIAQANIGAEGGIARANIGAQAGITQANIGAASALATTTLSTEANQAIAQLGVDSDFKLLEKKGLQDLENLRQQGASAQELATLQGNINTSLQEQQNAHDAKKTQLMEGGMNARLSDQIASNKQLFDLEMIFKENGQSIQGALADEQISSSQADTIMSQAATVINTLDPLMNMGFELEDIHGLLNDLEMPFAKEIAELARNRHNNLRQSGQNFIPGDQETGQFPGFIQPPTEGPDHQLFSP